MKRMPSISNLKENHTWSLQTFRQETVMWRHETVENPPQSQFNTLKVVWPALLEESDLSFSSQLRILFFLYTGICFTCICSGFQKDKINRTALGSFFIKITVCKCARSSINFLKDWFVCLWFFLNARSAGINGGWSLSSPSSQHLNHLPSSTVLFVDRRCISASSGCKTAATL